MRFNQLMIIELMLSSDAKTKHASSVTFTIVLVDNKNSP